MPVKNLLSALFGCFVPKTGGTLNPASSGYTEIGYSGKMGLTLRGGTANTLEGATLNLFNKAHAPSEEKGAFRLITAENTNGSYCYLLGLPDGRLQWNGNEIERVNSRGDGWIRFTSGIQIVWGRAGIERDVPNTPIQFPVPFIEEPIVTVSQNQHDFINSVDSTSQTGMTLSSKWTANDNNAVLFIAFGNWR